MVTLSSLQDSEELLSFSRDDPPPLSVSQLPWVQKQPLSPWLLVHFHGGGFVAQTSKSHEVRDEGSSRSHAHLTAFSFPVVF